MVVVAVRFECDGNKKELVATAVERWVVVRIGSDACARVVNKLNLLEWDRGSAAAVNKLEVVGARVRRSVDTERSVTSAEEVGSCWSASVGLGWVVVVRKLVFVAASGQAALLVALLLVVVRLGVGMVMMVPSGSSMDRFIGSVPIRRTSGR